ncbi:hypothetical protein PsorP6_012799 [Peronosclerospora sorghi]|uniref:Uncharacterized protein n=1 Tax=Peronosclerospora sorghi TaxID=230839 RepID=A0ACC0WEV7_9STRA|nr:hypothetical protein PsorP6_012799 [Peronosclerospora sorghi]
MTFYRFGQQLKMTRAVVRAMARSSASRRNSAIMEKLVQTSRNRFGNAVRHNLNGESSVARPLGAALATCMDSGVAFNTSSEFLYFDGDDDDGT